MLTANLKHLMMWHIVGKDLKSEQVPVMEILKEFRALAGIKGRYKHKPSAPPQYDFKVKMRWRLMCDSVTGAGCVLVCVSQRSQ